MENNSLFSEFQPVSAAQWKQKINLDLKGADYNETLVWESLEGINVKPFYSSEDLEGKATFSLPENHFWKVGQAIYAGNPSLANKKALDVLSRGAQSLLFKIPENSVSVKKLLDGIDLESTTIHFEFGFLDASYIQELLKFVAGKNTNLHLNLDLLGNLSRTGNWFLNKEKDHNELDTVLDLAKNHHGVSVFSVDTSLYQNAGANMVQQIAYGLAQANEYLNHYEGGLLGENGKSKFIFKTAIGNNYFFEIAKLRALRWLWQSLSSEYGLKEDCHILAIPSKRNKTLYDYNVNMLRTSTECMAAVLGGADVVCNLAYDSIYHKDNEFGERIARNQLLLLKEESYFDEAVSAAEGNYYIEVLTNQLAEKALVLFKEIESSGGLLAQLMKGIIQRKIKEASEKEQSLFDSGKLTLIGTNKFENTDDKIQNDFEVYPFVKTNKRQTILEPVIERRLAEGLEQKRMNNE